MKEINNISDIHGVLFETLCYFDDFCKENDIKYFISNGTLLGAAKYKKFIPWDDDVDVMLPREDYDKLVKLTQINNEKYRLLCREQIPLWRIPYAKLSREDTVVREWNYDFGNSFGISVDIFPIDRWSPCLFIARIQAVWCALLKRMLICSNSDGFATAKRGIKKVILWLIYFISKAFGTKKICARIERVATKSKRRGKRYSGCVVWTCHNVKEIFPDEMFELGNTLTFLGREFPVFKNYEEYLDRLYDNWRDELPLHKQRSNHDIKAWWKNEE